MLHWGTCQCSGASAVPIQHLSVAYLHGFGGVIPHGFSWFLNGACKKKLLLDAEGLSRDPFSGSSCSLNLLVLERKLGSGYTDSFKSFSRGY